MPEACAFLHICTTCRSDPNDTAMSPGAMLHARLAGLLAMRPDTPVELIEAKCLANCEHGCSGAIAMPGKWSYLLGGLDMTHAADLLDYAATYAASRSGVVMPSKRPASLAAMVRGRIPALPAVPEQA